VIDRRTFLGALSGGLLAAPLAAEGQQAGKPARVGYLSTGERLSPRGEAFKQALREYGWVEGQNLVIEYRFGGEQYERLPPLAADLVRLKVDVIFAASAPAAQAAKETTSAIPIVFHTLNDPVRAGLVASFARPGGNMTGNAGLGPELDRKRIELVEGARTFSHAGHGTGESRQSYDAAPARGDWGDRAGPGCGGARGKERPTRMGWTGLSPRWPGPSPLA
jgi:ABC transporter substrate binding protein